ncbi:MAG: indolepyruvate ferredoxin oxidoreductase [Bacteroidales bacterium]|nr:indolepyruvate ferredoxin oxidoreductase [Bacteroidales bacterium]
MSEAVLLGAEAIAQGAIDGGMSGIYAYPGTPSTEITEYVQHNSYSRDNGIHSDWSANEKTAMETAIGMSYAGKRAMVCMKHVGLNVAADPFINSAITGAVGGLIVVVADDPSMHSSQNEQDSRFYGDFALLPVLEPSDQQEAYDMAYDGFELSEQVGLPVMMRITTRLSHSRARVNRRNVQNQNNLHLPDDRKQFILLPNLARKRYKLLLKLQDRLIELSEKSNYNKFIDSKDYSRGIIACGISYNYLKENYPAGIPYPVLKIGQYPPPISKIEKIQSACEELLILEEGYPLLEKSLKGLINNSPVPIRGRLDGSLPRDGELNPDIVRQALGMEVEKGPDIPEFLVNRPPALCDGCGHIDTYKALLEAIAEYGDGRTFSDIGCYTLGALPPYNAINSCVDMGASITMAKGASDAGLIPAVAVIGDSTFTHSGMTGLLDVINEKTPVTIIISDNETTGMTGGQSSSAHGRLESICLGLGVDKSHLKLIIPLKKNHNENVEVLKEELNFNGVSVVISRRECIQTASKRRRNEHATKM